MKGILGIKATNRRNQSCGMSLDYCHTKKFLHYCGAPVGEEGYHNGCVNCEGRCGPNKGCQCVACWELDEERARRQLLVGLKNTWGCGVTVTCPRFETFYVFVCQCHGCSAYDQCGGCHELDEQYARAVVRQVSSSTRSAPVPLILSPTHRHRGHSHIGHSHHNHSAMRAEPPLQLHHPVRQQSLFLLVHLLLLQHPHHCDALLNKTWKRSSSNCTRRSNASMLRHCCDRGR